MTKMAYLVELFICLVVLGFFVLVVCFGLPILFDVFWGFLFVGKFLFGFVGFLSVERQLIS